MSLLEVKNINAGYGKKQVLYDISFEVDQGDTVLLIGANGSGKSTILKTVYGLISTNFFPDENKNKGQIIFNGKNITDSKPSKLLNIGLTYLPQRFNHFENLTVKENLEVGGISLFDKKLFEQRYERVLNYFPQLRQKLNSLPSQMSWGERQTLSLAISLLHEPLLLMMDEPFSGIMPSGIQKLIETLEKIKKEYNITLLIVEHNIKPLLSISSKVIGLKLGRIMLLPKNPENILGMFDKLFL